MLTRESFVGPWAGLPVAWTGRDEFDEQAHRANVRLCCQAGVPGVYTGGTTGEFYAMELDEFRAVARATVDECRTAGAPCMVGCTATYTRGVLLRAAYAVEIGASAVQVALPFWLEVGDAEIVPFFREVARAAAPAALSIYETRRAKKALTIDQHRAIKDAAPNYSVVKANDGTVGVTQEGCETLSQFINVFTGEHLWAELGPRGVRGGCSSMVYWSPRYILELWKLLQARDWPAVEARCRDLRRLLDFLFREFGPRGFTDSAWDRLGAEAGGFTHPGLRCREPYPHATPADVEKLRAWYGEHFPAMLRQ